MPNHPRSVDDRLRILDARMRELDARMAQLDARRAELDARAEALLAEAAGTPVADKCGRLTKRRESPHAAPDPDR